MPIASASVSFKSAKSMQCGMIMKSYTTPRLERNSTNCLIVTPAADVEGYVQQWRVGGCVNFADYDSPQIWGCPMNILCAALMAWSINTFSTVLNLSFAAEDYN